MDMYIIYTIQGNNKLYVGSTRKGLNHRKNKHLNELRRNGHGNGRLQNFYNKYGEDSLCFSQIYIVEDPCDLLKWEQYYIDLLMPWFNICRKAGNTTGRLHTEESKEKLRIARNNRPPASEETRRKMSESQKGKTLGIKRTPEQIEKLRLSHLGIKPSEEARKNMSAARMGHSTSEETKKKISDANKRIKHGPISEEHIECLRRSHIGIPLREETKIKIGNANRGRKRTPEQIEKLASFNRGRKLTEEHKEKLRMCYRDINSPSRIKMSESLKKAWVKKKLDKEA